MQFEVTKADSHKRTANNSIEVLIPEELQVRVILKIDIETSMCSYDLMIRRKKISFRFLENEQLLLRTYSTMMANETVGNSLDSSYDSILENAQRTVFLKELFSQVNSFARLKKSEELPILF
jgi:hypothetical protein